MDADSWEQRKKRFRKKFENAKKHYRELFKFDFETIEQIAILGFNNPPREFFNIAKTQSIPQFIEQVAEYLSQFHPLRQAVPEK